MSDFTAGGWKGMQGERLRVGAVRPAMEAIPVAALRRRQVYLSPIGCGPVENRGRHSASRSIPLDGNRIPFPPAKRPAARPDRIFRMSGGHNAPPVFPGRYQ